ncbi:MAG: histidine phosphatase family protein [Armatimonadota bacterium]|nr:histidine phosphatase family protein [Armatimonadota bacterium]
MAVLYIVRHGQCENRPPGVLQGQIDSPLTELGLKQAQATAQRLSCESFAAAYSSDLSRARLTAEAIAEPHQLPVATTELLRECCLGQVQGLTELEFAERYPEAYRLWKSNPVVHRPPGAERFEDVIERCGTFLKQVRERHAPEDRILVVGHIGSISGLICAALELPLQAYFAFEIANASLSILQIGEKPALILLNDTCHLAGLV